MGNTQSIPTFHFESIQKSIQKNDSNLLLINTLSKTEQQCLILNTLSIAEEEKEINQRIRERKKTKVVIYGKNCNDKSIFEKYLQLSKFPIFECFIYVGGLFEWITLQEIYGSGLFPTDGNERELLKYK
tara:strand:+ start:562 stop:948 length:387 start_codon:yes stop_codon:yes gene_type:complete